MKFKFLIKQAIKNLKRKPGFVAAIVSTMGLTIGALLCILTLSYVLLVTPLPYPEQERLFKVEHILSHNVENRARKAFNYPAFLHLYENHKVFEQAALYLPYRDVITSHASHPAIEAAYITPELFSLFDIPIVLGRGFEASEAKDTFNPVALISHRAWQEEFDGDADILNKKLTFNGVSYKVIGVISSSFGEPELDHTGQHTKLFLPWDFNNITEQERKNWAGLNPSLTFIAKMDYEYSIKQVLDRITPILNEIWVDNSPVENFQKNWKVILEPRSLKSVILGDTQSILFLLLIGISGLVIIAAANITNLFMSRTAEQQRQMAISAALGASKKHLFYALFVESCLLMTLAVILGLFLANIGFLLAQEYLYELLPRVNEVSINGFAVIAAIVIMLIFGLFFSWVSSSLINYRVLNSTLQSSGKGTGVQVSSKIRKILVLSQVAIATAMLFVNVGLFKNAMKVITEPMGFEVDNIYYLQLAVAAPVWPAKEESLAVINEFAEALSQLPEIEMVSQSISPLRQSPIDMLVSSEDSSQYPVEIKSVDENYFRMLGQELNEGDFFTRADVRDENSLFIIDANLAEEFSEDNALGKKLLFRNKTFTVSGVVNSISIPGRKSSTPKVYFPFSLGNGLLMIKINEGKTINREQIISLLKSIDPLYTVFSLEELSDTRNKMLFTEYTIVIVTFFLTLLSFALSAIGLYGVFNYGVQLRRFELGIRMAIGAKPGDLNRLILSESFFVVTIGVMAGIALLLIAYISLSNHLVGYLKLDVVFSLTITIALIAMVSLFASLWPLRKFAHKPVIHALRGNL